MWSQSRMSRLEIYQRLVLVSSWNSLAMSQSGLGLGVKHLGLGLGVGLELEGLEHIPDDYLVLVYRQAAWRIQENIVFMIMCRSC